MSIGRRILLLGATGRIGRSVAPLLAGFEGVRLGLASRAGDAIGAIAEQFGAEPVIIPTLDNGVGLDACFRGWDVVINAAGPEREVVLPVLRACIRTGAAYGDIGAETSIMRQALALDRAARERGITALCGIGTMPGTSCLLARHAIASFDTVEEVTVGVIYPTPDRNSAAAYADDFARGCGSKTWHKMLFAPCDGAMIKDGYLRPVRPDDMRRTIRYADGIEIVGTVSDFPEVFLLDRARPDVARLAVAVALDDPFAAVAWQDLLASIARGGSRDRAAASFFRLVSERGVKDATLTGRHKVPVVNVTGTRGGRRIRNVVQTTEWIRTEALMLAMVEWLTSDDSQPGVFSAEDVFDATSFFTRAYALTGTPHPLGGFLLEETTVLPDA